MAAKKAGSRKRSGATASSTGRARRRTAGSKRASRTAVAAKPNKKGGAARSRSAAGRAGGGSARTRRAGASRGATSTGRQKQTQKTTRRKTAAASSTSRRGTSRKTTRARTVAVRRRGRPEEMVPMPPSSLNLDRGASAVRTGHQELAEHLHDLTQTGPALTGGDIDADWQNAYSSGEEAPGGDHATPDQDIVDEVGRALGVEYQDNEELRGANKIEDRDRHRWELDPASAEDYQDRAGKKKK